MGWSWSDVRVSPATSNNLILQGLVKEKFRSNSYRGLLLTELGREQAKQLVETTQTQEKLERKTVTLPSDFFDDIIGHDEIKELLKASLLAERSVHVLLAGPPALSNSFDFGGITLLISLFQSP